MNLVNLYEYIKQIALSIPIVKSYYNTSVYECWDNQEVKYGSVAFVVKSTRKQNGISRFDCVLYYGDRLNENRSNRDSIQSDAIGVINNIINRLNCSSNIEYVTTPVQAIIFEQQFADELAGAYANLTIDLQSNGDCCDFNLFDDYYTKEESNNRFQPKGEYVTDGELNEAIAGLNDQIDDIQNSLNGNYYVNIAPNYTFESNTTVSKDITGVYYNKIKAAVADNKMVLGAIVDGAVKTFNLIEQGEYNLRFASCIIDASGVLTDYIVLTEVQAGFPPENVTVGHKLTYQSEYSTYPTADLSDYVTDEELNEALAGLGDPDNYYNKEEIDAMIGDVNRILDSLINDVDTDAIKNQLNNILYVI